MSEDQHTDVPPNHLSIDPRSPFYSEEVLSRDVGIRFNGTEKTNVHEYDVAEGWVRVEVPTAKGSPRKSHGRQAQWHGRTILPMSGMADAQ